MALVAVGVSRIAASSCDGWLKKAKIPGHEPKCRLGGGELDRWWTAVTAGVRSPYMAARV